MSERVIYICDICKSDIKGVVLYWDIRVINSTAPMQMEGMEKRGLCHFCEPCVRRSFETLGYTIFIDPQSKGVRLVRMKRASDGN